MYITKCVHGNRYLCIDCEIAGDSIAGQVRDLVANNEMIHLMESLCTALQMESAARDDIRYDILSQKLIRVMREMEGVAV